MTAKRQTGVVLVAMGVLAAAFTGGALAASDASVSVDPAEPGETATHTVMVTVGDASAGSWNGLEVDYADSGSDVSDVGRDDITTIGIDDDGDDANETIDREVGMHVESVSASDDGTLLTVSLDGSDGIEAGDELVVVYENARNPDAGEWEVGLDIDPQSSGGETTATLALGGSMEDDGGSMGDGDSMSDGTETDAMSDGDSMEDDEDDSGTGGSAPGFGAVAALLAVIAAGLFARRRRA
jgi:PGF-CTERM protein